MAGEIEGALADQTYRNIALTNFLPNTCVDVDAANSDANSTACLYVAAGFPCETLGVVYDQAKLDPSGTPIKNSGVAVRHWGIARVVVTGAVTPGAYVSVANALGQCASQALSTAGQLLKPVVGRALTSASALNDTPLVLLMIGSRV